MQSPRLKIMDKGGERQRYKSVYQWRDQIIREQGYNWIRWQVVKGSTAATN